MDVDFDAADANDPERDTPMMDSFEQSIDNPGFIHSFGTHSGSDSSVAHNNGPFVAGSIPMNSDHASYYGDGSEMMIPGHPAMTLPGMPPIYEEGSNETVQSFYHGPNEIPMNPNQQGMMVGGNEAIPPPGEGEEIVFIDEDQILIELEQHGKHAFEQRQQRKAADMGGDEEDDGGAGVSVESSNSEVTRKAASDPPGSQGGKTATSATEDSDEESKTHSEDNNSLVIGVRFEQNLFNPHLLHTQVTQPGPVDPQERSKELVKRAFGSGVNINFTEGNDDKPGNEGCDNDNEELPPPSEADKAGAADSTGENQAMDDASFLKHEPILDDSIDPMLSNLAAVSGYPFPTGPAGMLIPNYYAAAGINPYFDGFGAPIPPPPPPIAISMDQSGAANSASYWTMNPSLMDLKTSIPPGMFPVAPDPPSDPSLHLKPSSDMSGVIRSMLPIDNSSSLSSSTTSSRTTSKSKGARVKKTTVPRKTGGRKGGYQSTQYPACQRCHRVKKRCIRDPSDPSICITCRKRQTECIPRHDGRRRNSPNKYRQRILKIEQANS